MTLSPYLLIPSAMLLPQVMIYTGKAVGDYFNSLANSYCYCQFTIEDRSANRYCVQPTMEDCNKTREFYAYAAMYTSGVIGAIVSAIYFNSAFDSSEPIEIASVSIIFGGLATLSAAPDFSGCYC